MGSAKQIRARKRNFTKARIGASESLLESIISDKDHYLQSERYWARIALQDIQELKDVWGREVKE